MKSPHFTNESAWRWSITAAMLICNMEDARRIDLLFADVADSGPYFASKLFQIARSYSIFKHMTTAHYKAGYTYQCPKRWPACP